jgi:hypothetical protein
MSELPVLAQVLPLPIGVRLYAKALIFDRDLEWHEYKLLWDAMQDIRSTANNNIPYWLGDLLNKVEIQYGETYAQLVEELDIESIGTLRNYKWICGRVPPQMRMEISPRGDIPFTYAKIAAPIRDPEERKKAIKAALKDQLTTREFKERVMLDPARKPKLREYPVKDELRTLLAQAFDAVSRQDWEEASEKLDAAILMVDRLR